jgi:hypothetical protein
MWLIINPFEFNLNTQYIWCIISKYKIIRLYTRPRKQFIINLRLKWWDDTKLSRLVKEFRNWTSKIKNSLKFNKHWSNFYKTIKF